ncbi:heavy metal-binding domain-containing protein [Mucilaginibacter sp.]|jgi:hypothetical protein|uniref:heavy metal-binding domain-containing protein n=1 Tax=Mucilaginibacter sp. TaxID=1882438 RepID=UPI0035622076
MKRTIIILAFAALTIGVGACNNTTNKNAQETAKPKGKYYCTMHPEVTSEKPGTCSKCGMDLAERDTTGK